MFKIQLTEDQIELLEKGNVTINAAGERLFSLPFFFKEVPPSNLLNNDRVFIMEHEDKIPLTIRVKSVNVNL